MEESISDTLLKAWTNSILEERKQLATVGSEGIKNGSSSKAQITMPQIQYIDSLLMKLYLLSKIDAQNVPQDIIDQIRKEINTPKNP